MLKTASKIEIHLNAIDIHIKPMYPIGKVNIISIMAMKTTTLNLPDPLYQKISLEIEESGFAGMSDFLRFAALFYFWQKEEKKQHKPIPMIEDDTIQSHESKIVRSLAHYIKNPKNIARVIHIEN